MYNCFKTNGCSVSEIRKFFPFHQPLQAFKTNRSRHLSELVNNSILICTSFLLSQSQHWSVCFQWDAFSVSFVFDETSAFAIDWKFNTHIRIHCSKCLISDLFQQITPVLYYLKHILIFYSLVFILFRCDHSMSYLSSIFLFHVMIDSFKSPC